MTTRLKLLTTIVLLCVSPLVLADNEPTKKIKLPKTLPQTKLAPAVYVPGLTLVDYPISTTSPECKKFFNQGLGYYYSYVYMEGARSMETAVTYDPECPMAWWGLSRALERYRKGSWKNALKKAQELLDKASPREKMLITARLQWKGLIPELKDKDARKEAAIKTLDELLALHEDDQEAWIQRAMLAADNRTHGGNVHSVPFYKALLHVNPLHPSANHELVHFYETFRRPALGWPHAEKYIQSSPKIPHAWHMQAHLAMRLGKWDKTTDRSKKAYLLEKEYHKVQKVSPKSDRQLSHHMQILTIALAHDGRFKEANEMVKECRKVGYKHNTTWFGLYMDERNYEAALKIANSYSKKSKSMDPVYMRARVYLAKNDLEKAAKEIETLEKAHEKKKKKDKRIERYLNLTKAILLCRKGNSEEGLKLFKELADFTANDFRSHSWGAGASVMEIWGLEALRAGHAESAEEAFLEAIAHDPNGSVRGALGMQVLCEQQNRTEEAKLFSDLARRCWHQADPGLIEAELTAIRSLATANVTPKTKAEN